MELHLQKYLRAGRSPQDLEEEFGVYNYEHPNLPLVGFKYGLIESDKIRFHPIVRESRGTVLERDSWNVVAYPFSRFFNLGDDRNTESQFNWNDFTCHEKLDGSLIISYYYAGQWHVNTSGSFAKGLCYNSGLSWEELFWQTSGIDQEKKLIKTCTYIFELCTKYNKVVRSYDCPFVSLLGIRTCPTYFEGEPCVELDQSFLDSEANSLCVVRPAQYDMASIDDVMNFLLLRSKKDPTFEGVVLCDNSFNRIKVKTDSYKQLHQLKGNNQFVYKNIIPQILAGNINFLLQTFPEWSVELTYVYNKINRLKIETDNIWFTYQLMKDRKKFAQKVNEESNLPAFLFHLRDGKFKSVDEIFSQNADYLVKYFEGKK